MNIGILTIATGKYKQFVLPLYKSILKNFLPNHKKLFILFTDQEEELKKDIESLNERFIIFKIERKGFPGDTLLRYHHFSNARESLKSLGPDCPNALYYFDADMLVEGPVGDEVLPTRYKTIVATAHPGYYNRPGSNPLGTPETNNRSTAYIPNNRWRPCYWAGGFNGGEFEAFMSMSTAIVGRIDKDTSNNLVAVWHDESHLNALLSEDWMVNQVKTLLPAYCYPESWKLPYERKILALDKNHKEIRNV
jgi:hypothetical protein